MLKESAFKRIFIATLALFTLIFLYLFPIKNNNEVNESITYINAIKMPIYLIDENNYVARVHILKNSENINDNIKEIIKNLTINEKNEDYLPEGFKAIIPSNTKINSFSLNNGLLKLDFSKEFLNISKNKEVKLIETLIFSLTELKEVKKIMIFIDGEKLNKLPHSKIYLPENLDKSFGINKVYELNSFKNIVQTTTYYIAKNTDETYYIPISKYSNDSNEKVEIIIKNLKSSPINQTNLISYLKASASLKSYQILEEGIILSFDNNLIADLSNKNIIEEVKYSIYLSLRDTYNIESVSFNI